MLMYQVIVYKLADRDDALKQLNNHCSRAWDRGTST